MACYRKLEKIMLCYLSFHLHGTNLIELAVTRLKIITCSRLLKTGCNNVVLPTLFIVVNNIVQHC